MRPKISRKNWGCMPTWKLKVREKKLTKAIKIKKKVLLMVIWKTNNAFMKQPISTKNKIQWGTKEIFQSLLLSNKKSPAI
jgi:hypothetical protein